MSHELPEETRDEKWPEFGPHKTFLAIETRLDDDITGPKLVRLGSPWMSCYTSCKIKVPFGAEGPICVHI